MEDKNKIVMAKYPEPILSECCGAPFTSPGWPDSDFCSDCKEHSSPYIDEDEDETTLKEIETEKENEAK